MKKRPTEKVDSFEKLGSLIVGEIQDLREEMNERFGQVNERFEQIDERFEKVDEQFERIEQELTNIRVDMRGSFETTQRTLDRHDTRISALEYKTFGASNTEVTSQ